MLLFLLFIAQATEQNSSEQTPLLELNLYSTDRSSEDKDDLEDNAFRLIERTHRVTSSEEDENHWSYLDDQREISSISDDLEDERAREQIKQRLPQIKN